MGVVPDASAAAETEGAIRAAADRAKSAAAHFDIPLLDPSIHPRDLDHGAAVLQFLDGVPSIQLTGRGVPGAVTIDFADKSMANRRRAGHNELLGKAVGWKQAHAPKVLDATGGYGRDAFLLADLGCEVMVCERNPVMAWLFQEALARAELSADDWLVSVVARMRLQHQDAQDLQASALKNTQVIYIDPMFPLDRRAAPAKEMQVLHQLLAEATKDRETEGDREARDAKLLAWARMQDVRRVVVKRPRRAPVIEGPAPGHSVSGKSVRFDVYPLA